MADLRLFLNDWNVTRHMIADDVGDHVTVALYGMVNGLVHDWWSIFGARDREVSLRDYRTGYLVPDIRIRFDGAVFEISAHESVYTDPDLRFWGGTTEILPREAGDAWLSSLVEDVLDRLAVAGIRDTGAALRWRRVQRSRRSDEREFCEAAGSLGLDPYTIAENVADFIEKAEAVFEGEALVEFTSGSANVDRPRLMGWVEQMMQDDYRLADLRAVVDGLAKDIPRHLGERAWAAGYRRARVMRRELGLEQHHRFGSFRDLARRLGAAADYDLAPEVDGISALRREGQNDIHVHIRDHGDVAGAAATHLFALARAIGDAVCFPQAEASPINRLSYAFRQAAGRAFAAEFLAPIDEIQSMLEDEHDEYSIANAFGVSSMVIDHQIENRDRIADACA